jgi:aspartate/methionine/tyrosine aminotransferase
LVAADGAPLGFDGGVELCRRLPEPAGVVAVPVSAFTRAGSVADDALRSGCGSRSSSASRCCGRRSTGWLR